jgi:transcription-repair coupling factor (superfamily II helicase)
MILRYFCTSNPFTLNSKELLSIFRKNNLTEKLVGFLLAYSRNHIHVKGLAGSSASLVFAAAVENLKKPNLFILNDKEAAAYFYNDLENLFNEQKLNYDKKRVLFFPTSYKKPYHYEEIDNANVLARTEVLNRINADSSHLIIITYPEALSEKVITRKYLQANTMKLQVGEKVSLLFITELLSEYGFDYTDFVLEPGTYSVRGGLVDFFSFTNDLPYRIEFTGDEIESIRTFNFEDQLSVDKLEKINILPNIRERIELESRESLLSFIPENTVLWINDFGFCCDRLKSEFNKASEAFMSFAGNIKQLSPSELYQDEKTFSKEILNFSVVETGRHFYFKPDHIFEYDIVPQPAFNKNFDLIITNFLEKKQQQCRILFIADNPKQSERLRTIFDDVLKNRQINVDLTFDTANLALHEGFIDKDLKIACYTDHQIFERYHHFHLKESFKSKDAMSVRDISNLKPGDFVTHIDHGIGRFDGLEKIEVNGKPQEALRISYKDSDILYVSIHSLHRISKYAGKEGTEPTLHRLGSNVWNNLKQKTKQKVKDIARDLIKLYAQRKSTRAFQFLPDNYLQNELEASFIYEDTPDQVKATADVKNDMQAEYPMDRLICGDVGFGKTEIAIRAAFKAVCDSKQVAILVPTTILALQHYNTFRERLKEFPCTVEYINRFKSTREQHNTLKKLEEGQIDILIGTHRLVSADIKFKDLGLLVIDEEQKFGVAVKEKLKKIKLNVDTLTLTATPIPRTLQFSLMGARDLSIINTPPPNRYPVHTELHSYNEQIIRDAIIYEISRGGQVFFVNNRIQNITEISGMIQRLCPDVKVGIGHGQMEGKKLEKMMIDFINGDFDVLVATTIIESGLDIPNANTIIINDAHHYGLSDLHQMRGRVGRTNKKAFCYLLAPPLSILSDEARKRLKAIEEFSELGSGFNIAMRDLDIRGAGNLLGAEQSGFISDIGFEMYHKILDEALAELKDNDLSEIAVEKNEEYVRDCLIETDLEILIPDNYVNNVKERITLYKELDSIEDDVRLIEFQTRLIDRFGQLPKQAEELIDTIRLRWLAKEIGFEKIVLKNGKIIGSFVSNQQSDYFHSEKFSLILDYIKKYPKECMMKEIKQKLQLTIINVRNISEANDIMKLILNC